MHSPLPENVFHRDSQQLIRRLNLNGGYLLKSLTEKGVSDSSGL